MALRMFLSFLYIVFPIICSGVLHVQKRDWLGNPPPGFIEGDVECFSEYMELWIHRMRIEGLRLWLSAMLRIQVTLGSLESLNHQLSACGFGLHKDPDRNYIFRVMYSGCFVQQEHGHYVIVLNLMKRISRFGGRTHNYVMKCPVVPSPPNTEHIQCDPDFIQVTRQIPVDSWNNELKWSLALRGRLVVALEDASLIQVNVDVQKPLITVQGRRNTILSPVQVLETEGQFLPLKLVSGQYAYSMEATCPNMIQHASEDTVVHIYKRRMGLTKRGGYDNETLSVSTMSINQTDTFTWSETTSFVKLIVPTAFIQKTKKCADKEDESLQQSFFRIDVVLSFKETNNRMLWTMENTSPCSNYIPSMTAHPPVTPSFSVSALNPTLLNSVTEEPTRSFNTQLQTSLETDENRFSKTSKVFQSTSLPGFGSGPPQTTGSTDSEAHNVFRTASFNTDNSTDDLNPDVDRNFDLTTSPNLGSNETLVSSSFSPHPGQFMDLIDARETSTVTPYEQTLSNMDHAERSNTSSKVSKAVIFTAPHSQAETTWNTGTLSSYVERTSADAIPNIVSERVLNTPPTFLPPSQLHQQVTRPPPSHLRLSTTVHSALLDEAKIIQTTHKGSDV